MDELGGEVDQHYTSSVISKQQRWCDSDSKQKKNVLTQASVLPIIEAQLQLRSEQHHFLVIALKRYCWSKRYTCIIKQSYFLSRDFYQIS